MLFNTFFYFFDCDHISQLPKVNLHNNNFLSKIIRQKKKNYIIFCIAVKGLYNCNSIPISSNRDSLYRTYTCTITQYHLSMNSFCLIIFNGHLACNLIVRLQIFQFITCSFYEGEKKNNLFNGLLSTFQR